MLTTARLLTTCCLTAVLASCASPQVDAPKEPSQPAKEVSTAEATSTELVPKSRFTRRIETVLHGQWEGTLVMRLPLTSTRKNTPPVATDIVLRIKIDGEEARVYLSENGKWIEMMPGRFMLSNVMTNASIVGVMSDHDGTRGWIENWSILLTAENDDTVLAEWSRVVNNLDPGKTGLPIFGMAARGVLRRVPSEG